MTQAHNSGCWSASIVLGTSPTLINLIEASRGTGKREGLHVYAMHLMELSERSSASLMVHKARKNGLPFWNKGQNSDSTQIVVAFEAFQDLSRVFIRPTTAISPMFSMHEDICSSADSKRAAMIILPLHKRQRLDGQLETTRADFRHVNQKILEHAPCSVGILVDRGLGGSTHILASNVDSVMMVLFFGGHDDHEALAYGARMAELPGISLLVVRFLLNPKVIEEVISVDMNDFANAEERGIDKEVLDDFKKKITKNSSIKYEEKIVGNAAEIIDVIRQYNRCNMFLVGSTNFLDPNILDAFTKWNKLAYVNFEYKHEGRASVCVIGKCGAVGDSKKDRLKRNAETWNPMNSSYVHKANGGDCESIIPHAFWSKHEPSLGFGEH